MSLPLPSGYVPIQSREDIAQLVSHRRSQRRGVPGHRRPGLLPMRLDVWRFICFGLVFILLKGMMGMMLMTLWNLSIGYAIGDAIASVPRVLNDLRKTNIAFSWLSSAIAFSLTTLVFFIFTRLYNRYRTGR